jgi:hypothetical protein
MPRAERSSIRHTKNRRTLRLEHLERRAMLSTTSGPVITLQAVNTVSDVWNLQGTVTEPGCSVAGLTVQFGGVLASNHLTATVQSKGTFSVCVQLPHVVTGVVTAQTQESNVAMTFIENATAGASGHVHPPIIVSHSPPHGDPRIPYRAAIDFVHSHA